MTEESDSYKKRMLFELEYWKQLSNDLGIINSHSDNINDIVRDMLLDVAALVGTTEGIRLMGFINRIQDELQPQVEKVVETAQLIQGRIKALREELNAH